VTEHIVEYTWCEDDDYPPVAVATVIMESGGNIVDTATAGLKKLAAEHHELFQRDEEEFLEALDFCVVDLEVWLNNARENGKALL